MLQQRASFCRRQIMQRPPPGVGTYPALIWRCGGHRSLLMGPPATGAWGRMLRAHPPSRGLWRGQRLGAGAVSRARAALPWPGIRAGLKENIPPRGCSPREQPAWLGIPGDAEGWHARPQGCGLGVRLRVGVVLRVVFDREKVSKKIQTLKQRTFINGI